MTTFTKKDEFSILVQANQHNRHLPVLSAAAELFALNNSPSRDDLLHFEELCLRFLPKLDLQTKAEISERLSNCVHLPHAIAITLAREDISIAAPILKHYNSFKEEDLLAILANGNLLHALAISSREKLSDKTTIALSQFKLPDFGPHEVEQNARPDHLENTEELSVSIEADSAAARLIEPSHISSETSDEFTIGLDAFLANEHAHVLTQLQRVDEHLSRIDINPATAFQEAYNRAEFAVDFVKLARAKDADGFGQLLAKQCALSKADAAQIIDDEKGFALAICLKSLALPSHAANEAFILLNPKLGHDVNQVFLLNWLYDLISPALARSLTDNWSEAKNSEADSSNRRYQPVYEGKAYAQARPGGFTRRAIRTSRQISMKRSAAR
ncbi:MAG: hypothetical protein ABJN24_03740 [Hyphomicrobiales bacterium]